MTLQAKINMFVADVKSLYVKGGFDLPDDSVTDADLDEIEKCLTLNLPVDFRQIALDFCGHNFSLMPQLPIKLGLGEPNISSETLEFRKDYDCPLNLIVLAAYDETVVLMKTGEQRDLPTPVYITDRCAPSVITDNTYPLDTDDVFDSYSKYFEYCLDREIARIGK